MTIDSDAVDHWWHRYCFVFGQVKQGFAGNELVISEEILSKVDILPDNPRLQFLDRAHQERSRAERYCLFLSVVIVDISDFNRAVIKRAQGEEIDLRYIQEQIQTGIRQSVRNSDVISSLEDNRLGLLLVETSRAGLDVVVERIESFVIDFLGGQVKLPFKPTIRIDSASFPEESGLFSNLVSWLARERQSVTNG